MKTFALKLLVAYAIDATAFLVLFQFESMGHSYLSFLSIFLFPVLSAITAESLFALILRIRFSVIASLLAFISAFFLPLVLLVLTVPDKFISSLVTIILYNVVSPAIAFVIYGFVRERIF